MDREAAITFFSEALQIGDIVGQLRAAEQGFDDETLSPVTPLVRKPINPFGRYHFDLDRMKKTGCEISRRSLTEVFGRLDMVAYPIEAFRPVPR